MSARGCPGCQDPATSPPSPHWNTCSFVNALRPDPLPITPGELGEMLAGWVALSTLPDDPLAMRRVIAMAMLFGMERGLELGERGLTVEITAAVRVALREVRA